MKSRVKHHIHKNDKIHEALDLLNDAAKEKKQELYELIGDKYSHIRGMLNSTAENGRDAMAHVKQRLADTLMAEEEKIIEKAKNVEKKIQKNPWGYVGGTAFVAYFVGYLMGKKS